MGPCSHENSQKALALRRGGVREGPYLRHLLPEGPHPLLSPREQPRVPGPGTCPGVRCCSWSHPPPCIMPCICPLCYHSTGEPSAILCSGCLREGALRCFDSLRMCTLWLAECENKLFSSHCSGDWLCDWHRVPHGGMFSGHREHVEGWTHRKP